jgi:predicted phage terminase large subunit-like protein
VLLPTLDQVDAQLAASSLREYGPMAWPIVEPGTRFKSNWHIEAIGEHLEAVTRGEIRRLIVNIPPRHMKSTLIAVLWPTWVWLREPALRWLFVSYAEKLSKRDSLKCRRIIESQGGRHEGGTLVERVGYQGMLRLLGQDWELASDQNEKMRFENTATGYRLSTSVGGTATGEGGDIIVVDDPHKADEVESDVQRENVHEFLDGTLSSRLNDPTTGRLVVVMQRLHEDDATGHLLAQGGYEHLCLPAEYEPSHPFIWPDDPRTEPGELLWPEHFDRDAIDTLKRQMGSYRAAGQLQQRPAPAEGGIFKTAWWSYYDPTVLARLDELVQSGHETPGRSCGLPHFTRFWQSWDTALKEKTTSDFAAGQLWAQIGPDRYLLRAVKGRWGLTETVTQVQQMDEWCHARWPGCSRSIFVENKANGPEVIAALRKTVQGVVPVNPSVDKVTRAHAITPQLEGGNVYVPGGRVQSATGWTPDTVRTPAWVQELIAECAGFPNTANDDQVDALTQALDPRRLAGPGGRGRSGTGGTFTRG